jgi:hypothetical protein
VDVVEYMNFITDKPRVSEDRKHLHYEGTLRTNLYGPVSCPELDSLWQLTFSHRLIFSHG